MTDHGDIGEKEATARAALLLSLRQRGLRDRNILRAMEQVPRQLFIAPAFRHLAWSDQALPIECGQSISQPSLVARMTEALDPGPQHRVLEIGTGSGYQAAVLAHLAGRVVTLERFRTLAAEARARLKALGLTNVDVVVEDGRYGYLAASPYDRIMITAAVREVPPALLAQLNHGGVLVAPLGDPDGTQILTRIVSTPEGLERRELGRVRFVPLLPGVAEIL
ncbi:protein-L-isoaspartate(D-aspartate) O-methyltransferase [Ancylobacter sp. Lp-2]|uniref:protein-L-isoaspartate(D-aspartate) O-methyltransferase n=1 Tax=Ancylobacter sp. Lp-2 TaxID=2881339 RepID=UPI001E3B9713|nr:protein-L-isoaspartate(D-aspartate) O-methyltransferase [Ancylobacter sp. Lp-2]MCB4770061.1 protein-L-isoaspartate(D-aspartate) O-methyltransferase [Ancylobacter sp. Lp-2]